MDTIQVGRVYQHFKGKKYYVLAVAKHSESLEDVIVYVPLYQSDMSQVWVRPASMFLELIEREGKTIPRFSLL